MILLDEVEKAHPDVFNILLQVLDDGRLTDGQGRTVDFRNTVIVMTSNLGSHQIQELAGDDSAAGLHADEGGGDGRGAGALPPGVHQPPRRHRRVPSARQGADPRRSRSIQIADLEKRLAERGSALRAVATPRCTLLGNVGFDPVYGARPLKRAIQQQLENPLAQKILAGEFVSGDTVKVDAEGGQLVFAKA